MSEIRSRLQEQTPGPWSILGEDYDPEETPPDPLRLKQIERSVVDLRPDTAARSWATQFVEHAIELCNPELLNNRELSAHVFGDIAEDSHVFGKYFEKNIDALAEELQFNDDAPIMRALSAIFDADRQTRSEKRSNDINEIVSRVPNLSKRLVQYIFIKQQGLTYRLSEGGE